jgi:hypothetical protein
VGLRPRVGRQVTFWVHDNRDNYPIGDMDETGNRLYEGEVIDTFLTPNFMSTRMVNSWKVRRLSDGQVYDVHYSVDFKEYIKS